MTQMALFVIAQEFWNYFLLFYRTESDNSRSRKTPKNHTLFLLGTPFRASTLFFQLMDQSIRYQDSLHPCVAT